MKLSKTQSELLEAMKNGVKVYRMSGMNSYFFRDDNMKTVRWATATAIEKVNGVVKIDEDWRGYTLIYKEQD